MVVLALPLEWLASPPAMRKSTTTHAFPRPTKIGSKNNTLLYGCPSIRRRRVESLSRLLGEIQQERCRTLASIGQPRVLPRAPDVFNEPTLDNCTVVTADGHSRENVGPRGPSF